MPLSEAWVDFAAGWCSGAASVLACQPIDTILTRFQAATTTSRAATTNATGLSIRSMAQSLTQSSGVKALWRGSSPMISAVPVQNALLMGGYGVGQKYSELYAPQHRLGAVFVGGCTGGVLQSFFMSPVELVKVSQQVAGKSLALASQEVVWNLSHVSNGLAWRGLGATLLRDGIPHGVWFVSYEVCKDYMSTQMNPDSVVVPLTSGAVAATVAWAVGYPADLIKTRIQAASPLHHVGIIETARQLVQEANGHVLKGLYRGFGMKLVRSIPASMIGFTTYELAKTSLEKL